MTTPVRRSMDNFGPEEMAIPTAKLVQNVGTEYAKDQLDAKPGDFFFSLTDEVIPQAQGFDIILVDIFKTRTYWGREEMGTDPPQCSSLDGITSQDGKECASCEHRNDTPWLLSKGERRNKCLVNYDIIAINVNSGTPMMIRTHGISVQSTRQLFTQLKTNRTLKGEYHRVKIHVSSAKKKTAAGEAFYFRFKVEPNLLSDKEAEPFLISTNQLIGSVKALPEPETEELAEMLSPDEVPQETTEKFAEGELITFEGSVVGTPELSFTPNGKAVCKFMVDKDGLQIPVVTWENLAERCSQELIEASRVRVEGKVKTRVWGDQNEHSETELIAKAVTPIKVKPKATPQAVKAVEIPSEVAKQPAEPPPPKAEEPPIDMEF